MFELCEQRSSLPLERERVIRLMMSFNEPMIAPPRHHVQPTHAYICTFKEDESLSVYIYLYLMTEKVGLMYKYAEELPVSEGSRIAEEEAVLFAEDMGFLMDDLKFEDLFISQQEKLLATIPMFTPITADTHEETPAETVEVAPEEAIEAAEEVDGEVAEETISVAEQPVAPEGPVETAEAVVEETGVEEQPEEEKRLEQKSEEPVWEPEKFLSKFRMRAAAERLKKNKV